MRIAYVSRAFDEGVQGKLNGGYTVASGLIALDIGVEHIEIKNTGYLADGVVPEIRDMLAYKELTKIDWDSYDYVLCGEYGFMPWFFLNDIRCSLLGHQIWTWNDSTAFALEAFLPFVEHVIASSSDILGLYEGKGIPTNLLPYPTNEKVFKERQKDLEVIWLGREEPQKNPDELIEIALRMPDVEFNVFSSTELAKEYPSNVIKHIARSREEAIDAINRSKVLLMTSRYETFGLVLAEGGMAGCNVIARRIFALQHLAPAVQFYREVEDAERLIRRGLKEIPKVGRDFWTGRYSMEVSRNEWLWFLKEITK